MLFLKYSIIKHICNLKLHFIINVLKKYNYYFILIKLKRYLIILAQEYILSSNTNDKKYQI
jgi:hypothetical protein